MYTTIQIKHNTLKKLNISNILQTSLEIVKNLNLQIALIVIV